MIKYCEQYYKEVVILITAGLSVPWSHSYHNNRFETQIMKINFEIILLEKWQDTHVIGLSLTLAE